MMLRDVVNDKVGRERSRVSLSRDTARASLKFYVMTFVLKFWRGKGIFRVSVFASTTWFTTLGCSFFTTILISP